MKNYKEKLKDIQAFVFDIDGVLTDGKILVTTEGHLLRSMSVKDGFAIKTAVDKGYKIGIISGGTNQGVVTRLNRLGVEDVFLGAEDKKSVLKNFMNKNGVQPAQVLYMGDDIPDIEVLQMVGVATCPQDAVPIIKGLCDYISHKNGGDGCVREIIEQVLKVKGDWFQNP